ncbi:peptidoglycan recognition protein family protein [Yinghuangia aomiensis]
MAWYPGAIKMELQPESDSQPAIKPTQLIMHSIAAPWTPGRIYEYWRDSTNLESQFGLGYDGSLAQFIGTETRADANASANRRADGTGAVSIETASNLQHTDPWTDAQIATLIRLGVWMHQQHGVPLRICRTWDDPGFGYHRMFAQWSVGGTACPGDARVKQFHDIVFPGIVRAAQGGTLPDVQEDDMEAVEVWAYKNSDLEPERDAYEILRQTNAAVVALAEQVAELTAKVEQLEGAK